MKSAYERAMERFGSASIKPLTDDQKARLAEIDVKYKAKIAETELNFQPRLQNTRPEDRRAVAELLNTELATLRERCERDKDRVRNETP